MLSEAEIGQLMRLLHVKLGPCDLDLCGLHGRMQTQVPLLPPTDSSRVYPWLLTKGPDSKDMSEVEIKLCTAIAGAPFVSKLNPKKTDAKASKVKAAAIEEEEGKKQSAKGKAKSKAKAKSGKRKAQGGDDMVESSSTLQGPIEHDEGSRPRRWLDDLLGALVTANYGRQLNHPWKSPEGQLTRALISYGLEFGLTGTLSMNKKTFKDWSKASNQRASISEHQLQQCMWCSSAA